MLTFNFFVTVLYYQTLSEIMFVFLNIKMKSADYNKLDKYKVALEQHHQY